MIKVKITNRTVRNEILKNSYKNLAKLNKNSPKSEGVYINKDYTFAERQANKALREELKSKREETKEQDWVIRGGRIVKKTRAEEGERAQ